MNRNSYGMLVSRTYHITTFFKQRLTWVIWRFQCTLCCCYYWSIIDRLRVHLMITCHYFILSFVLTYIDYIYGREKKDRWERKKRDKYIIVESTVRNTVTSSLSILKRSFIWARHHRKKVKYLHRIPIVNLYL